LLAKRVDAAAALDGDHAPVDTGDRTDEPRR
jgi:hypothetical protein